MVVVPPVQVSSQGQDQEGGVAAWGRRWNRACRFLLLFRQPGDLAREGTLCA